MLVYTGLRRKIGSGSPTSIPGLVGWWKQGDWTASSERVSQWNDSSGNARHLLQAVGSNQPIELPWSGESYFWDNGLSTGGSLETVDKPAYAVSTISGMARIAADDWTPAAVGCIAGQFTSATVETAWRFDLNTTGALIFRRDNGSGTGFTAATSSATIPSTNMTWLWVMYTFDHVTGVVKFYTAPDGSAIPTSWTQLGTDQSLPTGAIYDSSAALTVFSATLRLRGKVKRFLFYSGIVAADGTGGTLLADMDVTRQTTAATSWVSATTGETWSKNSSSLDSTIVGYPMIVSDGTAQYLQASYVQAQPITRIALMRQVAWVAGDVLLDGVGAGTAALVQSTATPNVSQSAGTPAQNENSSMTLDKWHAVVHCLNGASSYLMIDGVVVSGGNPGATTTGGLTLFADGAGANQSQCYAAEIAEYSRALSLSEALLESRYLNRIGNLGLSI